ncbi:MAG: pyridoxal-phosphate dependent enzyme [Spirochaetota bacterium]|nr:pyridoxal-phosphate dependent enzyme [Spirochaetota bacterium]
MISLFKYFPQIKEKVPWVTLGNFPTRVTLLSNIVKNLPIKSFWVKRDDETSSIFGGNKIRNLEFEFGKIIQLKKKLILAYGSIGSNFTVACCMFGKHFNIPVNLILFDTVRTEDVENNYKINSALANKITFSKSIMFLPYYVIKEVINTHHMDRYLMPPGGTSPLSVLGYINAMFELKEQIDNHELPIPNYIFLPVGTGGTIAGLLIGKTILKLPIKIIGITVFEKFLTNISMIKILIYRSVKYFNSIANTNISAKKIFSEINLVNDFLGDGYAHPTNESNSTIKLLMDNEGLILDGTYTGKGMAGAINIIKSSLKSNDNVLFWHSYNSQDILSKLNL